MVQEMERIAKELKTAVLEVGTFIAKEFQRFSRKQVEIKGKHDLVSYVDREAEKALVAVCKRLLPNAGFIREEEGDFQSNSPWRWIIDPLDGTTNFVHHIPCFSISVALQYKEQTQLGIVYLILQEEYFEAIKGRGSFLNGEPIAVSDTDDMDSVLIATGFPFRDYQALSCYLEALRYFMLRTRGVRRMGSAAMDLAYVAAGRFDGFFEQALNAWDVAAGSLLVQEAGGIVTDFYGGSNYLFGRSIIAANPKVHEKMLQVVQQAYNVSTHP